MNTPPFSKASRQTTASRLQWLLDVPDPGPLELSADDLERIRPELSAFLGVPASSAELDDRDVKETYKYIGGVAERLRRGHPVVIHSYRIELTAEGKLSVKEKMGKTRHQDVLLATLLSGQALLRRCKSTVCQKVLVKSRRQEYCSQQCAQLARIRKFRAKLKKLPQG